MIGPRVRPTASTDTRQGYVSALAGLWTGLARTLAQLEAIAAEPEEGLADDATVETLPRLQYSLHAASELVLGLQPPPGAETAHAELGAALVDARDATAEVAEVAGELGSDAALPLVLEWRGALFRVRLARMRLRAPAASPAPLRAESRRPAGAAIVALLLVVAGAVAFLGGAMLDAWPLWTTGIVLVAAGIAAFRP
jgi:hypothetical protein